MRSTWTTTPGPAGYVLAYLIAGGVFALMVVGSGDPGPDLVSYLLASGMVALAALTLGAPFALVGVLLLHLCCRRAEQQWVHVVAAGVVGLVGGALICWMLSDRGSPPLIGGFGSVVFFAGFSTAAGRAAVVPLVLRDNRYVAQAARPRD